jgi:hypothetical protein
MIQKDHYLEISRKYGHCASWAIWADEGQTPKSNIGDVAIFNLQNNPNLLDYLNPGVIMVGLNISRNVRNPFGNFHDSRPRAQDYKIRYAFRNTIYYGAYMTDVIKDFEQVISGKVVSFLKMNPDLEIRNISDLRQEIMDLRSANPLIMAFGNHSFTLLDKHFKNEYRIIKVPHYSKYISKENYKNEVDEAIESFR